MANLRRRIPQQTESLFTENHEPFFNSIGQLQTSDSVDKGATPPRYFLDPARFRAYNL
jgi:hypothetical protein